MYKFLVLCVLSVLVKDIKALSTEQQAELQAIFVRYGLECSKEYPIQEIQLDGLQNSQFPEGMNAGCFAACVFKKAGIFDDFGMLSPAKAIENIRYIVRDQAQLDLVRKVLDACTTVNQIADEDRTGCRRAPAAYNCLLANSKKVFEFVKYVKNYLSEGERKEEETEPQAPPRHATHEKPICPCLATKIRKQRIFTKEKAAPRLTPDDVLIFSPSYV